MIENENKECYVKFNFEVEGKANGTIQNACSNGAPPLHGTWRGIYKKDDSTYFVKVNFHDNMIQPWKCRAKFENMVKWNNTHSYAENNKFYSAIMLQKLEKCKKNFTVICTKRNGKSKSSNIKQAVTYIEPLEI